MKTISLAVSEGDYEAFRRAAKDRGMSIAQLIRSAMALYRRERLEGRTRLTHIRVFHDVELREPLPKRWEIWDEIWGERWDRLQGKPTEDEEG